MVLPCLWWCYHVCMHMSKVIKMHTSNICTFLCKYATIKWKNQKVYSFLKELNVLIEKEIKFWQILKVLVTFSLPLIIQYNYLQKRISFSTFFPKLLHCTIHCHQGTGNFWKERPTLTLPNAPCYQSQNVVILAAIFMEIFKLFWNLLYSGVLHPLGLPPPFP